MRRSRSCVSPSDFSASGRFRVPASVAICVVPCLARRTPAHATAAAARPDRGLRHGRIAAAGRRSPQRGRSRPAFGVTHPAGRLGPASSSVTSPRGAQAGDSLDAHPRAHPLGLHRGWNRNLRQRAGSGAARRAASRRGDRRAPSPQRGGVLVRALPDIGHVRGKSPCPPGRTSRSPCRAWRPDATACICSMHGPS